MTQLLVWWPGDHGPVHHAQQGLTDGKQGKDGWATPGLELLSRQSCRKYKVGEFKELAEGITATDHRGV